FIKPQKVTGYYFRFWIFKRVFILSTNHGLETVKKNKNKVKILFGVSGTSLE
ncbi:MAG: DUF3977 family protein, partial [Candidatus Sungbacteria bacterium]|nr:DUF3977 family protein [Candidatus Sungbacteria bacterium]